MESVKTIGQSRRYEQFGILQFWEFLCQPFGQNTFSKHAPNTKNEKLRDHENNGKLGIPSCFLGDKLEVFKVVCLLYCFPDPERSKEVWDMFYCIGDVFGIELAYGNG